MHQDQPGAEAPHQDADLLNFPRTPFVPCERDPRDPESAIWLNRIALPYPRNVA